MQLLRFTRSIAFVSLWLILGGTTAVFADLGEIRARGKLRVLAVENQGPAHFVSTDQRRGFDYEILEAFARMQRAEIEIIPVALWADLVPSLLAEKGDLIAGGVNDTASRRQLIDFTVEVLPTRNVVITRKPHPPIPTLDALRAARVGTVKGTAQNELLLQSGIASPRVFVADDLALTEALRTGKIDARVAPLEMALVFLAGDPDLRIDLYLGARASLAYGVRKQDPELRAALSEYVSNVRKTSTWNRLLVKYFGELAVDILRKARSQ